MAVKTKHSQSTLPAVQAEQMKLTGPVAQAIKTSTRARPGQPTIRTREVVEEILDRISCGEALLNICQDAHLPGYSTFNRWQREDAELLRQVDIAYEFHARTMDDMTDGILSGEVGSTGDFRRDEARVAHLRWRLAKLNRRKFAERLEVNQNVTVKAPQMPDWFLGQVIDGQLTDDSDPTI